MQTTDLGTVTEFDALLQLLGPVEGKLLLDIGCGHGGHAQAFAEAGAQVLGFEPDPGMFATLPTGSDNPSYQQVGGEALPLDDSSADIALFCYSLHHVPAELREPALHEALRVLRPGGLLCVAEPLAEGRFHEVMAPFHDETRVRSEAQAAISAVAATGVNRTRFSYRTETEYTDFDAFAADLLGYSCNPYTRADVEAEEVRRRFADCREGEAHRLEQPVLVDLLRA